MTLDELLADLDREVLRTWGEGSGGADAPEARTAPGAPEVPGSSATPGTPEADTERCLLVTLAGRRFAVPARSVLAVSELPPVSAVPFAPPWLRGVARAAGAVVAVVDLARLLAFTSSSPEAAAEPASRPHASPAGSEAGRELLLVVKTTDSAADADADLDCGLAVRGVASLVSLAGAPGRPPARGEIDARRAALVAGLVPDPAGPHLPPVAVLDIDRLLRRARQELGG